MKRFVSLAGALIVGTVVANDQVAETKKVVLKAEPELKVTAPFQSVNHGERQIKIAKRQQLAEESDLTSHDLPRKERENRQVNRRPRHQSHVTSDDADEIEVQYRNFSDISYVQPRRQSSVEVQAYRKADARTQSVSSWDKEEQAYKQKLEVRERKAPARSTSPDVAAPKVRVARQRNDSPRSWDSKGRTFSARNSSNSASSHDIEVQKSLVGSLDYNVRPAEKRASSPASWDELVVEKRRPASSDASSCDSADWEDVQSTLIGGDGHDDWQHKGGKIGGDGHDDWQHKGGKIGGDGHDDWQHKGGKIGGDGHDDWQHKGGKIGGDGHDNWRQRSGLIGGGDHDQWWKHRGDQPTVETMLGQNGHGIWNYRAVEPIVEKGIIGGDDHDYKPHGPTFKAQPIIGGGDHDQWWKHRGDIQPQVARTMMGGPTDPDHYRYMYQQQMPKVQRESKLFNQFRQYMDPNRHTLVMPEEDLRVEKSIIGGGDHDQWWNRKEYIMGGPTDPDHYRMLPRVEKQLIGGGDHDQWWNRKEYIMGGPTDPDHYRMLPRVQEQLIGGGDHDYWWRRGGPMVEDYWASRGGPLVEKSQLIGGGDHDQWWKHRTDVIGRNDGHDNWQRNTNDVIIGGGDHDQWWKHRGDVQPKVEEQLIGGGDHDQWWKFKGFQPKVEKQVIGGGDHDQWWKHRGDVEPLVEESLIGGGDHDQWWKHRQSGGYVFLN